MRNDKSQLAFSVSIHDCTVQTFRAGGKGGQHQNVTDSGVRVIHEPSGARGESREERSQLQNKKTAFRRMTETMKFKIWINQQLANKTPEQRVEEDMAEKNILVEVRGSSGWEPIHDEGL